MVSSWFISSIGSTSIWIEMSLKRIFQGFWPHVENTYFVEHLSMVAYDNEEKQYEEKQLGKTNKFDKF